MEEYLYLMWFIAGVILIFAEIILPGFVVVWFGIGAVAAGVAALLGAGHALQIVVFFVVSIGSLIPAKLFLKKREKEGLRVGAERLIGMSGRVTKPIAPGEFGEIKTEGEIWIASAGEEIKPGEWVTIELLEGAHLVVRKKQ